MPIYENEDYVKLIRPIPKGWKIDENGIPFVKKNEIDISNINNGKWIINVDNASMHDKNASNKIVHCFKYDTVLNRLYNNPYKWIKKIGQYYAAATLDISMHPQMTRAQIIDATFKNRWSGVWLQMNGYRNVIVTVGWVFENTFEICFSGIDDGTTLMISTMGCCSEKSKYIFANGYKELRKRFAQSKIICIGNKLDCMDDDICYVKYKDSFGNWDKKCSYWQPALFN